MKGKNVQFLIIDPQKDFCDPFMGTLYVGDKTKPKGPGAYSDSQRLADLIRRMGKQIHKIHCTLDTHKFWHIAHPIFWWSDKFQKHPGDYELITEDDLLSGKWRTTILDFMPRALEYVRALKKNNRYILCIWPPHCMIGSSGHNIIEPVYDAFHDWENSLKFNSVDFVLKGSNMWTEHYSAVQADVIDPTDPTTNINKELIKTLQEADVIPVTGQALSHCLAYTARDIANNFGEENIKKFVLINDTTSPVADLPGSTMFLDMANNFVKEMTARGMQTCTSVDFNV